MGNSDFPLPIVHPDTVIPNLDPRTSLFIGGIWAR
jgi:hypothetical protein